MLVSVPGVAVGEGAAALRYTDVSVGPERRSAFVGKGRPQWVEEVLRGLEEAKTIEGGVRRGRGRDSQDERS